MGRHEEIFAGGHQENRQRLVTLNSGIGAIFPFFPRGTMEYSLGHLSLALQKVRSWSDRIVVVADGDFDLPLLPFDAEVIRMQHNVGKIAASRLGCERLLDYPDIATFAVCDWDDEQEVDDVPLLAARLVETEANAIIGERYGLLSDSDIRPHRRVANYVQSLIARSLGHSASDSVSGIIACDRRLAACFATNSKAERFSVGLDWMVLGAVAGLRIESAPIRAKMRADRTDTVKLRCVFEIPLVYEVELRSKGFADVVDFCAAFTKGLSTSPGPPFEIPIDILGGAHRCWSHRIGRDTRLSFAQNAV